MCVCITDQSQSDVTPACTQTNTSDLFWSMEFSAGLMNLMLSFCTASAVPAQPPFIGHPRFRTVAVLLLMVTAGRCPMFLGLVWIPPFRKIKGVVLVNAWCFATPAFCTGPSIHALHTHVCMPFFPCSGRASPVMLFRVLQAIPASRPRVVLHRIVQAHGNVLIDMFLVPICGCWRLFLFFRGASNLLVLAQRFHHQTLGPGRLIPFQIKRTRWPVQAWPSCHNPNALQVAKKNVGSTIAQERSRLLLQASSCFISLLLHPFPAFIPFVHFLGTSIQFVMASLHIIICLSCKGKHPVQHCLDCHNQLFA